MRKRGLTTILSKYLFLEMLQPVIFCIVGFTIVFMSGVLFQVTDMVIKKHVPIFTVLKILFYKLPDIFVLAFPLATLFATVFSLGRLAKDNEITIMRISGFGIHKIIIPFIVLGILISLCSFWINEEMVPWADHRAMNLIRKIYIMDGTPVIKENVFLAGPNNRHFYVRRVDQTHNTLHDVTVYETNYPGKDGPFPRVISAKVGVFDDDSWDLEDGVIHEFDRAGFIVHESQFETLAIPVTDGLENFYGNQKTPKEMTRGELEDQIDLFLKSGISLDSWQVEYHLKIALPFVSLIFVLTGVPLSLHNKKGWGVGVGLSLLAAFGYYVIQAIFQSLGENALLGPFWAAWTPNLIFGVIGLFLLIREEFFIGR